MGSLSLAGSQLMQSRTGSGKDEAGKMVRARLVNDSVSCPGRRACYTIRSSKTVENIFSC